MSYNNFTAETMAEAARRSEVDDIISDLPADSRAVLEAAEAERVRRLAVSLVDAEERAMAVLRDAVLAERDRLAAGEEAVEGEGGQ